MSTAVDARTAEEKRERRTLLPKSLPRHTERTSTSYDPWPSRDAYSQVGTRCTWKRLKGRSLKTQKFAFQSKKKRRKENKRGKYTDYCCYYISLIAFVDVQNLSLFTIQGVGQPVDVLVGKYQFRTMPIPVGLKKKLVERLYTMGSKRHALSGISGTLRPNQLGDRKPNSTELSGRAQGSQNLSHA